MTPDPLRTLWFAHSTRATGYLGDFVGGVAPDEAGHARVSSWGAPPAGAGCGIRPASRARSASRPHGARRRSAIAPGERVRAAAIRSRAHLGHEHDGGIGGARGRRCQPQPTWPGARPRRSLRRSLQIALPARSLRRALSQRWSCPADPSVPHRLRREWLRVPPSARHAASRVTRVKANAPTTRRPPKHPGKKATPVFEHGTGVAVKELDGRRRTARATARPECGKKENGPLGGPFSDLQTSASTAASSVP